MKKNLKEGKLPSSFRLGEEDRLALAFHAKKLGVELSEIHRLFFKLGRMAYEKPNPPKEIIDPSLKDRKSMTPFLKKVIEEFFMNEALLHVFYSLHKSQPFNGQCLILEGFQKGCQREETLVEEIIKTGFCQSQKVKFRIHWMFKYGIRWLDDFMCIIEIRDVPSPVDY
ncbi:MAG: hypothetical protein EOO43_22660 [Flavobacterium sp.]|nr:MAG: hypothetical protein EOO43_22660 [Flavobacterium sp.]